MITLTNDTKQCKRCKETKDISLFVKSTNTISGRRSHCKDCNNLYYQKRRVEQYEKVRSYEKKFHRKRALAHNYGITEEQYQEMLDGQNASCAICHKTPEENNQRLAVDHCHMTGKIRGLLCGVCNKGLGLFKDNTSSLNSAIEYLKRNE